MDIHQKAKQLQEEIEILRRTINRIDDYFEYMYKSKEDREQVHKAFAIMTKELQELYSK